MIKLPPRVDINNLIDDLRTFSWEISKILLDYAQIIKDSNYKSNIIKNGNPEDPVTLADLRVNEVMIQRINENYKNINWEILSEENAKINPNNKILNKDFLWVLDPLDGTKDFLQGTGNYAMHLGLNYKNKPYLGIVLIPDKDELWITNHEKVWCENRYGTLKKPKLSKKSEFKEMTIVTSKNHRNQTLQNLIKRLNFKEVIVMGSIGCKVASILRGESYIYICLSLPGASAPKDWDFAAPEALIKCAGGSITNENSKPLSYNKNNYLQSGIIIASGNSNNHSKLCQLIKEIIDDNNIL